MYPPNCLTDNTIYDIIATSSGIWSRLRIYACAGPLFPYASSIAPDGRKGEGMMLVYPRPVSHEKERVRFTLSVRVAISTVSELARGESIAKRLGGDNAFEKVKMPFWGVSFTFFESITWSNVVKSKCVGHE